MTKLARIASLLAFLFAASVSYSPAHAQGFGGFGGGGDDAMMDKMAPMLNMMKKKLGKKRFTTLMQTMGPMFDKMGGGGEGGFGGGGYGGGFGGMGGFDMGSLGGMGGMGGMDQLMSSDMIGTVMTLAMSSGGIGHHRKGRRSHKRH